MPNYLGQHFLQNPSIVKKTIDAINIQKGDTIIEVGPGRGVLTAPLAKTAEVIGANIIAIEKDKKLIEGLSAIKNIEIINDDVLTVLKSTIASKKLDLTKTKIVGNIPYYITGHLLRIIGDSPIKPERCVFMVQKEVAERIIAKPPKGNRLAASIQFWADPKIIEQVGRNNFSPPPEVDSSLIILETRDPQPKNSDQYYKALRALFAQPRKTIANNLAESLPDIKKENIGDVLKKNDITPSSRPQNLTIADINCIAIHFF